MKSKKINFIIIVCSLIFLFCYVFFVDGISNLINALKSVNPFWISFAVISIVIYWFLEAIILQIIIKPFHKTQKFKYTFKTSMIGQFFNNITPFASGGQPIQAYNMAKSGIKLGTSTTCLLSKFIIYQLALTLFTTIVLIFKASYFNQNVKGFMGLVIVGFTINAIIVLGLLSIGLFNNFTTKIVKKFIEFLYKIKLIKNYDKISSYVDKELKEFGESFKILKKFKLRILFMFILSLIQLTVFFSIPYLIYLSFGLSQANLIGMISAQSLVLLISSFVPLPGAIGGAEVSFVVFLKMFFPENLLTLSMLIWRLITFYLPILVGMFFVGNINKKIEEDPLN